MYYSIQVFSVIIKSFTKNFMFNNIGFIAVIYLVFYLWSNKFIKDIMQMLFSYINIHFNVNIHKASV